MIPTEKNPQQQPMIQDDEIDIRELLLVIWKGKLFIIGTTFLFTIIAIFYALSLPNYYKSEAIVMSIDAKSSSNAMGALASQYGGLASLAGIDISGGGGSNKKNIALATLKTRVFIENLIKKHQLLIPLFAYTYNGKNKESKIDPKIYDQANKKWMIPAPSLFQGYEALMGSLKISDDPKNGTINFSIEMKDPTKAKFLLELLLKEINKEIRTRDAKEIEKNIAFLKKKLEETQISSMKQSFFNLIEAQTKSQMFTAVKEDYVFEIIEPPTKAERKSKPKRSFVVISGLLLGIVLSMISVFFLNGIKQYGGLNK